MSDTQKTKTIKLNDVVYIVCPKNSNLWKPIPIEECLLLDYIIKKSTITRVLTEISDWKEVVYYGIDWEDIQSFVGKMNPKYIFKTEKEAKEIYKTVLESQKEYEKIKVEKQFVIKTLAGRYFF